MLSAMSQSPDYAKTFADRLNDLCEELDGPRAWTAFGSRIGTSAKNAERWCTGDSTPSIEQAAKIARRMGWSLDELVGRPNPNQAVAAAAEAVPDRLAQMEQLMQALVGRLDAALDYWPTITTDSQDGAQAARALATKTPKVEEAARIGSRRRSSRARQ